MTTESGSVTVHTKIHSPGACPQHFPPPPRSHLPITCPYALKQQQQQQQHQCKKKNKAFEILRCIMLEFIFVSVVWGTRNITAAVLWNFLSFNVNLHFWRLTVKYYVFWGLTVNSIEALLGRLPVHRMVLAGTPYVPRWSKAQSL